MPDYIELQQVWSSHREALKRGTRYFSYNKENKLLCYLQVFNTQKFNGTPSHQRKKMRIRPSTYSQQHGRRDSNSRHLVLETSALPTELHPYFGGAKKRNFPESCNRCFAIFPIFFIIPLCSFRSDSSTQQEILFIKSDRLTGSNSPGRIFQNQFQASIRQ